MNAADKNRNYSQLADEQFGNQVQSEDSFSCTEVFISKRANVQHPVRETGPFDNLHGGKRLELPDGNCR